VSYYNIYRESNYAGIYDLLASVSYDDLSVIIDSKADPTSRAYLYKITAVDPGGNETDIDLCKAHKTIHLLVTTNPETKATQLDWDRYVGFEYGTYLIYRSDTTYNFSETDQMASSSSTWSDPAPGNKTNYYRIAALKPEPCYPTGNFSKKYDSGPYSHALSNVEDNRLQKVGIINQIDHKILTVYPNPFNEFTTIQFSNPENSAYTLYVTDLSGKVCRIENNITSSEYLLDRNDLEKGIYFLEMRGHVSYRCKIMIE